MNYRQFHRQFRLMLLGNFLSTLGTSMIWPFLMIYLSERLSLLLASAALLLTIHSLSSVVSSFLAGPLIDRIGRKWLMVGSLLFNGLAYIGLGQSKSLPVFAFLMIITGAATLLYRVGADAMLADLIPDNDRVEAYSLMALSGNAGFAIGPAVGGFITSISYPFAFFFAAFWLCGYGILLAYLAIETMPQSKSIHMVANQPKEKYGGYLEIAKDKPFVLFAMAFLLVKICSAFIWTLLPIHAKQNFGIPENLYGFIPTTNAIMIVSLQIFITRFLKKYHPFQIMVLGGIFFTVGVGSVALGTGFWWFWTSMVVMTLGELVLMPTSSTFVANHAPPDKRGRYMSIYGLSWTISSGAGSLIGGVLNDAFGYRAIWLGGALIGLIGVLIFLALKIYDTQKSISPLAEQTELLS